MCTFVVLTLLPSTTVPVLGNQGSGFPLIYVKMLLSHLKVCDGKKKSHPQQGANCLKWLWLEGPLQETVPLQLQVSLPCGFLKSLGRSKVAGAVMREVRQQPCAQGNQRINKASISCQLGLWSPILVILFIHRKIDIQGADNRKPWTWILVSMMFHSAFYNVQTCLVPQKKVASLFSLFDSGRG